LDSSGFVRHVKNETYFLISWQITVKVYVRQENEKSVIFSLIVIESATLTGIWIVNETFCQLAIGSGCGHLIGFGIGVVSVIAIGDVVSESVIECGFVAIGDHLILSAIVGL